MTTNAQPRRQRIRKILLIVLGLGTCAGISLLAYFFWVGSALTGNACPSDRLSAIEYAAEIKLPPSATSIHSRCGSWQGYWGQISFDMNASDLNTFLTSTRVKNLSSSIEEPTLVIPFPGDDIARNIGNVTDFRFGEYQLEDVWQQVFIDVSDKSNYTVYVLFGRG